MGFGPALAVGGPASRADLSVFRTWRLVPHQSLNLLLAFRNRIAFGDSDAKFDRADIQLRKLQSLHKYLFKLFELRPFLRTIMLRDNCHEQEHRICDLPFVSGSFSRKA